MIGAKVWVALMIIAAISAFISFGIVLFRSDEARRYAAVVLAFSLVGLALSWAGHADATRGMKPLPRGPTAFG